MYLGLANDEDSKSDTLDDDLASSSSQCKIKGFIPPANWVNAPEFVPRSFGIVYV